ncbi:MAG: pantetheine-phosphate adenylyltransferase [Myxococcota bacterium]
MDYRHAVYAGSFDPVTLGHTSIIERAAKLFDTVTVAIGHNPAKKRSSLFSVDERKSLLERSLEGADHVTVRPFQGLLIDFCRQMNAGVIVRGLRVLTDFEYELQLGMANRDLAPEIETVFLFTRAEHVYVSSSLVKEIAMNGGDTSLYVSKHVREAMADKFAPTE